MFCIVVFCPDIRIARIYFVILVIVKDCWTCLRASSTNYFATYGNVKFFKHVQIDFAATQIRNATGDKKTF